MGEIFGDIYQMMVRGMVLSTAIPTAIALGTLLGFFNCVTEKDHASQITDGGDRAEYRDVLPISRNGSNLLGPGIN